MRKSSGLFTAAVFLVSLVAGVAANPALAEEKKSVSKAAAGEATIKEIEQNDKVRVYEVTYKPGDGLPSAKRPMRVVHVIGGGMLERTFEDGTKETVEWKTGDTKIVSEEKPYALKNVGKGVIHLLIVAVK